MKAAKKEAKYTFNGEQGQAFERVSYETSQNCDWEEAWDELENIFGQVETGGFPDMDEAGRAWENPEVADVMLEALETYRQELFIAADAVDTIIFLLAGKFKRPRPSKAPITERGQLLATATEAAEQSPNFAEQLAQ